MSKPLSDRQMEVFFLMHDGYSLSVRRNSFGARATMKGIDGVCTVDPRTVEVLLRRGLIVASRIRKCTTFYKLKT